MPEIIVEDQPWLGLVVLADQKHPSDSPGFFALARADEWHNVFENVTIWRGPRKREEVVQRKRLFEMDCRTVLVDEKGFYTCEISREDLKEDVERVANELLGDMANERAAEDLSYVDEDTSGDFDGEVWIKAEVGDSTAVNGEIVIFKKDKKPPRGYADTERGGYSPSEEQYLEKDERLAEDIASILTEELKRPVYPEAVAPILDELFPKDYIYWNSDSGTTEVWASKRAIKKAESNEEREAREKEERYQRMQKADRQRIEYLREQERKERAEKIKKGGYPGPKDWSPKGRLPGDY